MGDRLLLIDTETHSQSAEATRVGQDVVFPDSVDGWTDVLDCRHPPYTDQSIDENCEIADHVRKPYILVDPSQLDEESATGADGS